MDEPTFWMVFDLDNETLVSSIKDEDYACEIAEASLMVDNGSTNIFMACLVATGEI